MKNRTRTLYNPTLLICPSDRLFDREKLLAGSHCNTLGRGTALLFAHGNLQLVLKQYRRGGLLSRLVRDSYLFLRLSHTRMWREYSLLEQMRKLGLPVPRPIAARCQRSSLLTYRGDLISECIPDARTLGQCLGHGPLPPDTWRQIGRAIAGFHHHHICHADLNANNIMLTHDGQVYLIDFDKASIRPRFRYRWHRANLARLLRSLRKLQGHAPQFHFTSHNWFSLKRGYLATDILDHPGSLNPSKSP